MYYVRTLQVTKEIPWISLKIAILADAISKSYVSQEKRFEFTDRRHALTRTNLLVIKRYCCQANAVHSYTASYVSVT